MKPSVERLRVSPMDAMALAAGCCYGRSALREPEKESRLTAWALTQNPPHLSLAEHARWTFQAPLSFHLAETLLTLPKPPRYQAIANSDGYGLFGFNLSQLRAFHATGHAFALQAIELVREQVAPAVADLPRFADFHPARLVPDDELSPEQARTFRVFQFRIRCSRACSHQLVRHRDISFEQACVTGDSKLLVDRTTTRQRATRTVTIQEMYRRFQRPQYAGRTVKIRCVDSRRILTTGHIKGVYSTGRRPVYRVITSLDYTLDCTADHRFLVPSGQYIALQELRAGDSIVANGQSLIRDREWLEHQYRTLDRTLSEISALTGQKPNTIRGWVRKFGLQKPMGSGMTGRTPWNTGLTKEVDERLMSNSMKQRGKPGPSWRGEEVPSWRGDLAKEPRWRAYVHDDTAPDCCERCTVVRWKHRHHLDSNTLHNDRANIAYLCESCHREVHAGVPSWKVIPVEIKAIVYLGEQETYDLEMDTEEHNFVANGLVTHNSQRQGKTFRPAFVWPPSFERLDQWWLGALEQEMLDVYAHLERDNELRAEDARYVLPNAMATALIATADMVGWRHFLRLRGEPKAQAEIRYLAHLIREAIAADDPALVEDRPVSLRGLGAWLPAEVMP